LPLSVWGTACGVSPLMGVKWIDVTPAVVALANDVCGQRRRDMLPTTECKVAVAPCSSAERKLDTRSGGAPPSSLGCIIDPEGRLKHRDILAGAHSYRSLETACREPRITMCRQL
jgi:hypothetical protein